MRTRNMLFVGCVVYLTLIVIANILLARYGASAVFWIALFAVGPIFTMRDFIHDAVASSARIQLMASLIVAGSAITYTLMPSAGRIALASALAFLFSEASDFALYSLNERRPWIVRSNLSNVVGSLVDSVLFITIGFGAFLPLLILKQLVAKSIGGFLWSLILLPIRRARLIRSAVAR